MRSRSIGPGLLATTLALALGGCSGGEKAGNMAGNAANAANAAAEAANALAPGNENEAAADNAAALGDLGKYVGKYPFDKVGDHSWDDDPAVTGAIDAAVSDAAVRKWVREGAGPASPIGTVDGKIASWACEAHNCGAHQWVTLIDPKSGAAEICYVDQDANPGKARWFSGGKESARAGKCPDV